MAGLLQFRYILAQSHCCPDLIVISRPQLCAIISKQVDSVYSLLCSSSICKMPCSVLIPFSLRWFSNAIMYYIIQKKKKKTIAVLCYTGDQKIKSYSSDLIKILEMWSGVFIFNSALEACSLQIKVNVLIF